jgi:hypothetical protein
MTRRYLIVAVDRDGKEFAVAQVDTHPGAIAKAVRRKYLDGRYTKVVIKDRAEDAAERRAAV